MRNVRVLLVGLVVLAAGGAAALAQPVSRTFVSAQVGSDANNCQRPTPCRNFAAALLNTIDGGEIIALDSGGFGGLLGIDKSVSVEVPAGIYAGLAVVGGNDGITIDAGTGTVKLKGLTLNANGGVTAIKIDSAAAVYIEDVSVGSFAGKGIHLVDDTTLTVIDSKFRRNFDGIVIAPSSGTAQVTLEGVVLENHPTGAAWQSRAIPGQWRETASPRPTTAAFPRTDRARNW